MAGDNSVRRAPGLRVLFIAVLVIVPAELVYFRFADEPYPAVLMPPFGTVQGAAGVVNTEEVEVTASAPGSEDRVITDPASLLPQGSPALPQAILRSAFETDKAASALDTRRWLHARLEELGYSKVSRLEFRWFKVTYDLGTGERLRNVPYAVTEVDLRGLK
jgi:hypothetical protein